MNTKPKSPLSSIMDFFTKSPKELDNVKNATGAELAKLGAEIGAEDLKTIVADVENSLKLDLAEMGVEGQAQAPALQEFRNAWPKINEALLRRDLDGFIGNMDNLPILKAEKAKAKPGLKDLFAGIAEKLGFNSDDDAKKGFLSGAVGAWLAKTFDIDNPFDDKDEKDKTSVTNDREKSAKETPVESAEAEKKDKEILEKNIRIYMEILEKTDPAPGVQDLLKATENESDMFAGKVEGAKNKEKGDMEAQKEAIRQFMAKPFKDFGTLARVSPSAIVFKKGTVETKYEITVPEKDKFAVQKSGNSTKIEFDDTLSALVTAMKSIETEKIS